MASSTLPLGSHAALAPLPHVPPARTPPYPWSRPGPHGRSCALCPLIFVRARREGGAVDAHNVHECIVREGGPLQQYLDLLAEALDLVPGSGFRV